MVIQPTSPRGGALPRHCSPDTVLFDSGSVSIGQFRCGIGHPEFRDTGPIRRAVVVFPRTSVWIRHEGGRAFVADPSVVTIYNRGQRYERFAISPAGDACDWFALSDDLALDVMGRTAPFASMSAEKPFDLPRAANSAALYARQRMLQHRARLGTLTLAEAEEETIGIVTEVLAGTRGRRVRFTESARRRRDLAEAARAELVRSALVNVPVTDLAKTLGTSPSHLCRVFRQHTGSTLHAYRVQLRLRLAIEELDSGGVANLSSIAHDVGFASHAHFVHICRRELRVTPAALRSQLRASQD